MTGHKLFSVSIKLALIIFLISGVMLFIVKPMSAEFVVTIITMVLMLIMIVIGAIMIRKDDK